MSCITCCMGLLPQWPADIFFGSSYQSCCDCKVQMNKNTRSGQLSYNNTGEWYQSGGVLMHSTSIIIGHSTQKSVLPAKFPSSQPLYVICCHPVAPTAIPWPRLPSLDRFCGFIIGPVRYDLQVIPGIRS